MKDITGNKYNRLTAIKLDHKTDKGYCPYNCRFVERKDNARNKRSNIKVLYNGEMVCLKELAEKTGLSYQRIKTYYHNGKLSELLER